MEQKLINELVLATVQDQVLQQPPVHMSPPVEDLCDAQTSYKRVYLTRLHLLLNTGRSLLEGNEATFLSVNYFHNDSDPMT